MGLAEQLERTNRGMIAFDLLLGTGAALAPGPTLRVLGHDEPSPETEELFRRCGPVWLTFALAHAVAARRGERRDWWALAWLRGTELLTDILWSRSPGFSRPGARQGLWLAGIEARATCKGLASADAWNPFEKLGHVSRYRVPFFVATAEPTSVAVESKKAPPPPATNEA